MRVALPFLFGLAALSIGAQEVSLETTLTVSDGPRNSEGDMAVLKDGSILLAYTRFTDGGSDFAKADIAARTSNDGGATWSADSRTLVPNEGGLNVMSVSLLRLQDGRIALLYLRKNSPADCRPYLRVSEDEGQTWNAPVLCIDRIGYYVVNNDRLIQLDTGRLVIPVAIHSQDGAEFQSRGRAACLLSDDAGLTWRWSATTLDAEPESKTGLQEPGLAAFPDGKVWMYIRTDRGCQLGSWSEDGGDTWSPTERTSLVSPIAPATIERLPGTERLVAIWNDHEGIDEPRQDKRTPLTVAVSDDRGATWKRIAVAEDNPNGWFAYTAMLWTESHLLFAYSGAEYIPDGLSPLWLKVVRLPLAPLAAP